MFRLLFSEEKAEQKIRELESAAEKERVKVKKERAKAKEKDRQLIINLLNKNYNVNEIHELAQVPIKEILETQAKLNT